MYDAVVIGSGIGGLVSAGLLASGGLKTLLLEKHSSPGGYVSSFRRGGFLFDSAVDCVSGVAPGGLIYRVLELLGMTEEVEFVRVDPIRTSIFPDFEIAVDPDVRAYKEKLNRLFRSEASGLEGFFEKAGSAYRRMQTLLEAGILGKFDPSALDFDLLRLLDVSYADLLDDFFGNARLKAVLSDRCPFIGLPPSKVSACAMINMVMSYFELGAYRPVGGFQRLSDVLVEGIRKKGGKVVFGNAAKKIRLAENKSCDGVILESGEEFGARYIVSNSDFDLTFRSLLGGNYIHLADDMLNDPGVSVSFFIVYAGVKGDFGKNSSIGFYPSYDMEGFFAPEMQFREESTLGLTVASIEDTSRAPRGFHTVVLHEMADSSGEYPGKAGCIEATLKKAEKIFPDIRANITVLEAATPATLRRYTGNCGGAAFGWRQTPGFRGPKRHGIKNLYLAGHWADFGGGVLAAAYAGAKAAGEILAREGVTDVF